MAYKTVETESTLLVTREDLVDLLNEDLAREYQAIISYVVYSKTLKGAKFMNVAAELEKHAGEELAHALTIAAQIDYLGGMPKVLPKPVKTSEVAEEMLRFDLDNENETIQNYRQRVGQCEALGEFAIAEHIRDILVQEQDHQIALATALGVEIPNVANKQEAHAGPLKKVSKPLVLSNCQETQK
jgi:bacterioferritin